MSVEERKALATKAAHARWKKDPDGLALATHVRSGSEFKKRAAQPEADRLRSAKSEVAPAELIAIKVA